MSVARPCATFTAGVNAWSLDRGLRRLGQSLSVHGTKPDLMSVTSGEPAPGSTLFFTEEQSLERYASAERLREGFRHYPRRIEWPVDDKLEFAVRAQRAGVEPVPWRSLEDGPPPGPVLLKSRHSWRETRRLPRGYLVEGNAAARERLAGLADEGLRPEWFFWQRYVPGAEGECISVSGFWDAARPSRALVMVTRKVLNTDGVLGTGLAVSTVPDPADLRDRSARLLDDLGYQGPFELEFLRDPASGAWWVLELNPRFWLQHGLFVVARGNGLIRRYLDLDDASAPAVDVGGVPWLWIDGTMEAHVSMRDRPVAARLRAIRAAHRAHGGRTCRFPDIRTSWGWQMRQMWHRLRRRMRG
jgi:hypothetical protein